MKLAAVRGVVQNTTQKNMVSTIVGSLNQIMEVLILVAVLMAVVILYDLTNLNVSERIRELSTIKVLGFHTSETTMYIYRETILLSLLGILAGYGFGEWLHRYIITEVPPDEVMFDPAISWIALAAPGHRRGRGTSRARLDRIPPARNGGHARSIEISGMTLHETVSGAARQKPGEQPRHITGNNRMPDRARRSPCPHAHTDADDAIRAAPTRWPSRRQAHAYTRRPRRPPEPKPDRRTAMSSCCASNAPNTPANTSPEPAVAIQAGARPDRMIRVFPSPSAPTTMVTAPLSSTVAPVSSCARNAARNGRASTTAWKQHQPYRHPTDSAMRPIRRHAE